MRKSRLRKCKSKYRSFLFIAKVTMIWYLFVFSTSYFTSNTSALFTSKVEPIGKIESGTWTADYNLEFIEKGNANLDVCTNPYEITRAIKNIGNEDMNEVANYEVYYVENGNPLNGKKVGKGKIESLQKNETVKLNHLAEKPGRYAFVAKYETEEQQEIWSKEIKIDCDSGQNTNNENQNIKKNDGNELKQETNKEQIQQVNEEENINTENEKMEKRNEAPVIEEDQPSENVEKITEPTEALEEIKEEEINAEPVIEEPNTKQVVEQEVNMDTKVENEEGEDQ